MPRSTFNQQRYFAGTPEAEAWGIAVTAGGRQVIAPGAPYPPPEHPADHLFRWEQGRVLGACQLVFISRGAGKFESRELGLREIEAGTALLILPGVWHRYAPDGERGWTEQWIEIQGPVIERLLAQGVLDPQRSVLRVGDPKALGKVLGAIHERLNDESAGGVDPERAALGLQALALVVGAPRERAGPRTLAPVISRAERRLAELAATQPDVRELARELGVAYSYFRREFKRHTGLAPYQYVQQLRLERARRLIGSSGETLETIAERLGFASAYHLSAAFKKQYGQAPAHWRRGE